MPIQKVGSGYRWGPHGKIYYGPNAYQKALAQGRAVSISKARKAGHRIPYPRR